MFGPKCRRCNAVLRIYELKERICDDCLRETSYRRAL